MLHLFASHWTLLAAVAWWAVCVLFIVLAIFPGLSLGWPLFLYALATAGMSLVAFAAFALDKHWALIGGRRIPEYVLHALSLFGGWPGALLAQQAFRHKTRKVSFSMLFWLIVLFHGLLILLIFLDLVGLV